LPEKAMRATLFFPDLTSYLSGGDAPAGVVIAHYLIIAFVILAVGLGMFQFRRMRRRLSLLDEGTRARRASERALEEDFCSASLTHSAAPKQKRDPWEN
jgi:hypothetical protein